MRRGERSVIRRLLAGVLPALACVVPSALAAGQEWRRIAPEPVLEFPRDHGAHPGTRTEWWYFTGQVEDPAGRPFGFQFTIFRSGLGPGPEGTSLARPTQVYAGHLAIVDVRASELHLAERRRREGPFAGAERGDMQVMLESWTLVREEAGTLRIRADDPASGCSLELALVPTKSLVCNGVGGYSAKGPGEGNASAYVSWTRLAVEGRLAAGDGVARQVHGEAWFDHEWGSSQLGEGVVGWDWFCLQLDDGRELMLYALRAEDGTPTPFSSGTLVDADGTATRLALADFQIEPLAAWTSPHSAARYPARWTLRVPGPGLELLVEPLVADCELRTEGSTGVTYWEGPVRVSGSTTGRGYAELTGYADSLGGRF